MFRSIPLRMNVILVSKHGSNKHSKDINSLLRIAIMLLKYLKNKANHKWHLSNLITFLRINLFVKIDLWKWLHKPVLDRANSPPQRSLFDV
jgi:hypothetical protein